MNFVLKSETLLEVKQDLLGSTSRGDTIDIITCDGTVHVLFIWIQKQSKLVRKMLLSTANTVTMSSSQTHSCIIVPDFSSAVVRKLLDLMTHGTVEITYQDELQLLSLADSLGIHLKTSKIAIKRSKYFQREEYYEADDDFKPKEYKVEEDVKIKIEMEETLSSSNNVEENSETSQAEEKVFANALGLEDADKVTSDGTDDTSKIKKEKVKSLEDMTYPGDCGIDRAKLLDGLIELKMHKEKNKDGTLSWRCVTCDKLSRHAHHMRSHIESKHIKGFSFPCKYCNKKSKTRESLRHHVSRIHNKKQKKKVGDSESSRDLRRMVKRNKGEVAKLHKLHGGK